MQEKSALHARKELKFCTKVSLVCEKVCPTYNENNKQQAWAELCQAQQSLS